ncbi:MerR family transcriptional regulator [Caulobacter sp. AP07]|uniref:MerR family transcriptional regulator n=1 Tax=Caulobacter sp. AP07 TaxID=1144304 RepID=UPI0012F7E2CE|nr:MerR family transcriptional regulator [Caulobacter sp. AP07]
MPLSRPDAAASAASDQAHLDNDAASFEDAFTQARWRAFLRIVEGRPRPATKAMIGDVARWHGVTLKALHNLDERRITQCERGPGGVRFYGPDDQARIEVALTLRDFDVGLDDIRRFIELLDRDRGAARTFLAQVLTDRIADFRRREQRAARTIAWLRTASSQTGDDRLP